MGNKNYRYVPKKLTDHQRQKVEKAKMIVQNMINSATTFEDRKKAIYRGVDVLFRYISTIEEYEKGDRKAKKFEAEEYDVTNFGKNALNSEDCIDRVITEIGYGSKSSDYLEIEREFMKNLGDSINYEDLQKLAIRTIGTRLTKEQLEFMKKTNFLSEFFKEQNKSSNCEENIKELEKVTNEAKAYTKGNGDTAKSKSEVTIKGESVGSIANEYIKEQVTKSYQKAMNDKHYAPIMPAGKDLDMSIVCGLPGLGKSTIYINDLKKRGYLCVDLDDIAISLSRKFNVPINDATSGNLYSLAYMIHDSVVAQSMTYGYNIAIEKIGYTKQVIGSISDDMKKINQEVNLLTGKNMEYGQSLLMAAGSSISSAESNSIRNAEQIFSGSDLRAYHYADLIRNNNCTTYAYLAVLSDKAMRERFKEVRISDRFGAYEGLCINGENMNLKLIKKIKSHEYGN